MTTPDEVPMPPETLQERLTSDAKLWQQAYKAGQVDALREAARDADGDFRVRFRAWLRNRADRLDAAK